MSFSMPTPVQQLVQYYENGVTFRDYRNCYNYWKQIEILNAIHPKLCEISSLTDAFEYYKNIPYEHRSKVSSDDILDLGIALYQERLEKIYREEEREEYMNELGLGTDDDSDDDPDSDYE